MNRDYIFHEYTNSLCPECLRSVPAKIIIKDKKVYLLKYCPDHGEQLELLEENLEYFLKKKQYDKPGTPMKVHTKVQKGCPYDCGTCPQHDQHACIGLIEITGKCNLSCPLCYADAGQASQAGQASHAGDGSSLSRGDRGDNGDGSFISLKKIEEMIDFFQDSEYGQAEILQISGGEPTLHPDVIEIIRMAKSKKIKYVMLNTNGKKIAEDESFAKSLEQFAQEGGFEVYLQFDGFKAATYEKLRGANILDLKKKAIENLSKYKIPITLVTTVASGINDDEVGEIFSYAVNTPYIRGINYQPAAWFGRLAPALSSERVTLSGVMERLEKQTKGMVRLDDFIPLPCNVERVGITYLYKSHRGGFIPVTRDAKIKEYLHLVNNTFIFTIEDALKNAGKSIKNINTTCDCLKFLKDFKYIVPINFFLKSKEQKKEYIDENTFRISISSFLDAYNFDAKSMQKECVHVITTDLRKIPFSSYNILHRRGEVSD